MNIGLDMMGGDFAPLEAVKGIQLYLSDTITSVNIYCIGDETVVKPLMEECQVSSPYLHLNVSFWRQLQKKYKITLPPLM